MAKKKLTGKFFNEEGAEYEVGTGRLYKVLGEVISVNENHSKYTAVQFSFDSKDAYWGGKATLGFNSSEVIGVMKNHQNVKWRELVGEQLIMIYHLEADDEYKVHFCIDGFEVDKDSALEDMLARGREPPAGIVR